MQIRSLAALVAVLGFIGVAGLYGALRDSQTTVAAQLFDGPSIVNVLLSVTLIGVLIFSTAPRLAAPGLWLAAFGFSLALALAAVELRQTYPVGTEHAFPKVFQTFHLRNFNLTESLIAGDNVLRGRGNTLSVADGSAGGSTKIDTYRMPGYALFVASAGLLFRVSPGDLGSLGASTVYLQVLFFSLTLAFFAHNLIRCVSLAVAALLVALTCWFPQAFDMTQSDSTILACGLLIAGSLCLFYSESRDVSKIPLKYHLMLHAAFALYLLMRSDVLVGWAGVSLYLYWNKPKYFVLPLCFFLLIGSAWGVYKKAHGSDFVMTTSNVGHVAFVGLWQTAEHKFLWEPTDESYVKWINGHGYTYMEPRTDAFALREVARFWISYPAFVVSTFCYKAYAYFRVDVWSDPLALYPARWVGTLMRRFVYWLFLLTILVALGIRLQTRRTFLLGWPVFLNLPLFCLLQRNERYVPFVSCSFMFSALPLLLSSDFYHRIWRIKHLLVVALMVGTVVWFSAPLIGTALLSDRFRYWTPILDPTTSTLNVLRRE